MQNHSLPSKHTWKNKIDHDLRKANDGDDITSQITCNRVGHSLRFVSSSQKIVLAKHCSKCKVERLVPMGSTKAVKTVSGRLNTANKMMMSGKRRIFQSVLKEMCNLNASCLVVGTNCFVSARRSQMNLLGNWCCCSPHTCTQMTIWFHAPQQKHQPTKVYEWLMWVAKLGFFVIVVCNS